MADPTGVNPTGPIHNAGAAAPASTSGTFGRYTVVIGKAEGGQVQAATREVGLLTRNISLWDRIVNWITGSLDQEKNQALIDFIHTGNSQEFNKTSNEIGVNEKGTPLERTKVFEYILSGKTSAKPQEKLNACTAFEKVIEEALQLNDKDDIKTVLERLIKASTQDSALRSSLSQLLVYLNTEMPPAAEFDSFVNESTVRINIEDVVDDDYMGVPGNVLPAAPKGSLIQKATDFQESILYGSKVVWDADSRLAMTSEEKHKACMEFANTIKEARENGDAVITGSIARIVRSMYHEVNDGSLLESDLKKLVAYCERGVPPKW